jgi:hypothetical protein
VRRRGIVVLQAAHVALTPRRVQPRQRRRVHSPILALYYPKYHPRVFFVCSLTATATATAAASPDCLPIQRVSTAATASISTGRLISPTPVSSITFFFSRCGGRRRRRRRRRRRSHGDRRRRSGRGGRRRRRRRRRRKDGDRSVGLGVDQRGRRPRVLDV